MSTPLINGGAALAGLKVLSGVDRDGRRMLASERAGRSGVRGSQNDRTAGSDLIRASVPARTHWYTSRGKPREMLGQAAAAPKRNGLFVFHMAWRMTASLRATATFAFLNPDTFAILSPHTFSDEKVVCRVKMTFAAS